MAVPAGGADKRRQPVPAGLLHHHVQRLGMVRRHLCYRGREGGSGIDTRLCRARLSGQKQKPRLLIL